MMEVTYCKLELESEYGYLGVICTSAISEVTYYVQGTW